MLVSRFEAQMEDLDGTALCADFLKTAHNVGTQAGRKCSLENSFAVKE